MNEHPLIIFLGQITVCLSYWNGQEEASQCLLLSYHVSARSKPSNDDFKSYADSQEPGTLKDSHNEASSSINHCLELTAYFSQSNDLSTRICHPKRVLLSPSHINQLSNPASPPSAHFQSQL